MAKKEKYVYHWPRPMVTVDAVVFKLLPAKAKILLIKRKKSPFKDMWALPGGFIEIDEELENAAARELAEEAGIPKPRVGIAQIPIPNAPKLRPFASIPVFWSL